MIFSNATYFAASIAVGLGQVVDAYATLRIRGQWSDWLTTVFGLFEFAWAGVSFLVWRKADQALPGWLPVVSAGGNPHFFAGEHAGFRKAEQRKGVRPAA